MKHGLLTILLLLSLTGRAQIEVDAYRNLLIGGAEAPEMEDMSETDTYVPRIFINNRDGMFWQNNGCFFLFDHNGEELYLSGSEDKVALYNPQTGHWNSVWGHEGTIDIMYGIPSPSLIRSGRALPLLSRLRPVTYTWKSDAAQDRPAARQYGFLAQEVGSVLPEAIRTGASGQKMMDYFALLPLLTASVQGIQARMARQRAQAAALRTTALPLPGAGGTAALTIKPTSADEDVDIGYTLPLADGSPCLLIHTMDDKVLKKIALDGTRTTGSVQVPAADFEPGLYLCSLFVDGRPCLTRNIVISKRQTTP